MIFHVNGWQDVLMMSVNLNDIAVLNIRSSDYVSGISKNEAVNLLQKADLTEKSRTLKIMKIIKNIKTLKIVRIFFW